MTMYRTRPSIHRFEPATEPGQPPLLLLHGTGGDEDDLLPLGRAVAPGSALLSPRGKVLENGMPRFFRRLAEGVFDEADRAPPRRRARRLRRGGARGLWARGAGRRSASRTAPTSPPRCCCCGPEALAGAVLLRADGAAAPMPPARDLAGKPVLILSGAADPIVPAENAARLAGALRTAGALVDHRVLPVGHGLSQADISVTKAWLAERWPHGTS